MPWSWQACGDGPFLPQRETHLPFQEVGRREKAEGRDQDRPCFLAHLFELTQVCNSISIATLFPWMDSVSASINQRNVAIDNL